MWSRDILAPVQDDSPSLLQHLLLDVGQCGELLVLGVARVLVDGAPELVILRRGVDHLVDHLQGDLEQVSVAVARKVHQGGGPDNLY